MGFINLEMSRNVKRKALPESFLATFLPSSNFPVLLLFMISCFFFVLFCFLLGIPPCAEGIDLGLLIDSSKSVQVKNLKRLLRKFMPEFLRSIEIAENQTLVSVVMFHRKAVVLNDFKAAVSYGKEDLIDVLENHRVKVTFMTRIDRGLDAFSSKLFSEEGGDRENKANVLLVFTDGRPFPPQ